MPRRTPDGTGGGGVSRQVKLAVVNFAVGNFAEPPGLCVVPPLIALAPKQNLAQTLEGEEGGGGLAEGLSDCLPLAAPIGLLPLLILTLCGSERVLVVSTEPPDDLSCLTTPGVGRPRDGLRGGGGGLGGRGLLLRLTAVLIHPWDRLPNAHQTRLQIALQCPQWATNVSHHICNHL